MLLLTTAFVPTAATHAAELASDTAANYTSWTSGTNGGSGFAPWTITSNNDNAQRFAGNFLADAADSSVTPAINTGGQAFGLFANVANGGANAQVDATRAFAGGPLAPGQTFSLQIGVNFRDGGKGMTLLAGGQVVASFFIGGFPQTYQLSVQGDNPRFEPAGPYRADSLFSLSFTLSGTSDLTAQVTRTSSAGFEDLATLSTTLTGPLPDAFNLFYGSSEPFLKPNDLFFNNFAVTNTVVPEPGTSVCLLTLTAAAALVAAVRRRRGGAVGGT